MGSRLASALLIGLLAVILVQLWVGRGSVPSVTEMRQEFEVQKQKNALARLNNERLAAEVQDLKTGLDMVEEKARHELGMVKPDEIFVQYKRP